MVDVLIVDDDSLFAEYVSTLLSRRQFRTETATSAQQALALLAERPFDAVITDVIMPDMDGIEFLRELGKRYPALKVIAMTGSDVPFRHAVVHVMALLGAVAVLAKPLDPSALIAALNDGPPGGKPTTPKSQS